MRWGYIKSNYFLHLSCSLGVTIGYSTGGAFPRKDEVSFYNKDVIKEMISSELKRLDEEIDLVKEEFERI